VAEHVRALPEQAVQALPEVGVKNDVHYELHAAVVEEHYVQTLAELK